MFSFDGWRALERCRTTEVGWELRAISDCVARLSVPVPTRLLSTVSGVVPVGVVGVIDGIEISAANFALSDV